MPIRTRASPAPGRWNSYGSFFPAWSSGSGWAWESGSGSGRGWWAGAGGGGGAGAGGGGPGGGGGRGSRGRGELDRDGRRVRGRHGVGGNLKGVSRAGFVQRQA